jgi:hypothetical protein
LDCACNIEVEHDSGPELFKQKIVMACKEHWCCECGELIIKGTEYEYVKGKWDGVFIKYKTCLNCASLRNEFFTSYMYTQLWEDFDGYLESCDGDIPEDCITELLPLARGRVCEKIEDYWEHLSEAGF